MEDEKFIGFIFGLIVMGIILILTMTTMKSIYGDSFTTDERVIPTLNIVINNGVADTTYTYKEK